MPAALPEAAPESVPAEGAALTKTQKLAALLVMLGAESAAMILKQFQPREIEAICREMARFTLITREQQEEILREFSDVALSASTSITAGVEVTRTTLEKALGSFKASDVLGRVVPARATSGAMQAIADMDPRHIFNLVRDEQPQTIAFVISHLTSEKAAQVLGLLRSEQRDQVVERLATLAPTPVEVAEQVVGVLNAKLGVKQTRALSQTGGVTTAADILNASDKTLSRSVLANIEARNPDLCQAIRKKMFTFEDLLLLDLQAIQRILRETDMRDLTLALKKTSDPLRKLLLSSISRRAAETVQEELAFLGNVKLREVEAAQFRIIDSVRKLEAEGEIELDNAGANEYEVV
ncbi:MAG TPA: flagellar motor switch protein FliG [Candidatus Sulfotelmatobacter sp.]|nr:flagellar motor switch protein FliG [Candidatus Sulfotelmatobacter sp.]HWI57553.1 flagellar motor switch protein FliG [Bacillota bacterium]